MPKQGEYKMTLKQLIYRELYLSKKSILQTLGIAGIVYIFIVMVLLSCSFGNMAKYGEPEEIMEIRNAVAAYLPVMLYSIALVAGVDAIPNQIFADHLCGWHKFIRSSGVKARDYVGAKYASILLLFAAATLLMTIVCPVLFLLSGSGKINLTGLIIVLDAVLFFTDYNLPLFIWAKSREKALFWSTLPILVIAVLPVIVITVRTVTGAAAVTEDMYEALIGKYSNGGFMPAACIASGILAALLYVSFRLSVHFVEVEG